MMLLPKHNLNLDNHFTLTAILHRVDVVRYTPSGTPVLDVILQHDSWQEEAGTPCHILFELPAKMVGQNALIWQHKQGTRVNVSGFLAQRSLKHIRPVLRIQQITEYKG